MINVYEDRLEDMINALLDCCCAACPLEYECPEADGLTCAETLMKWVKGED